MGSVGQDQVPVVEEEGTGQVPLDKEKGTDEVPTVKEEGTDQLSAVKEEEAGQVPPVNSELQDQVPQVNSEDKDQDKPTETISEGQEFIRNRFIAINAGEYFSAMRCFNNCRLSNTDDKNIGYILTTDPVFDTSDWKCNNPQCLEIFPVTQVLTVLDPIVTDFNALLRQSETQLFEKIRCKRNKKDKELIIKMEEVLHKYNDILHPHHYLVLELTMSLMSGCAPLLNLTPTETRTKLETVDESDKPDNIVLVARKMEERAIYCLNILNRIQPSLAKSRGMVLYHVAMAKWTALLDARKMVGKTIPGICNPRRTRNELDSAIRITPQAMNALKTDIDLCTQGMSDFLKTHAGAILRAYSAYPMWGVDDKKMQEFMAATN